MKKTCVILLLLLTVGCSSNSSSNAKSEEVIIHRDFQQDTEQIIHTTDKAYEDNRELNDVEKKLLEKYEEKYKLGSFKMDGGTYELNDLEKGIFREVRLLGRFTAVDEALASEEDVYQNTKKSVTKYMEAKEIPDILVDRYPTYTEHDGIHPQLKKDTQSLVSRFDSLVNGEVSDVEAEGMEELKDYINKYEGTGFKIGDEHFLLSEEEMMIIYAFESLMDDFKEGTLRKSTIVEFNNAQALLE